MKERYIVSDVKDRSTGVTKRLLLRIKGIVQGVGFRPFIYNLATRYNLKGFVLNDGEGVLLEVEGQEYLVRQFLEELPRRAPIQSRIKDVTEVWLKARGYDSFTIHESRIEDEKFVLISPDLATCRECLRELDDPSDFRYGYPFINCTNCGPRFTIITDIPYDRAKTSMASFLMCPTCQNEFEDPLSRRFHAQPNACPGCGPHLKLLDAKGGRIASSDPIARAINLLKEGRIVAVKGLGGFHLACDALNQEAVRNLRQRKYREDKPFALMAPDLDRIREFCHVNEQEEEILTSARRPIVLLAKKELSCVAPDVAPGQKNLGFMLPYTPLHHLLLTGSGMILVMTSGNLRDEPISYENIEAIQRLGNIADFFLMHNRDIHIRCDDSVTRIFEGREMTLRRARGYVPYPIEIGWRFPGHLLACGGELKNTFCLCRDTYAFVSHHIGDLENLETLRSFELGVAHFERLFSITPQAIAYDLHPGYLSTKYALSRVMPRKFGIQHHHAHMASCMAEAGLREKVIGVSFDGTGYGEDGTIWGGEFLIGDYVSYERMAHFQSVPLPGGDKAIREPWRMALVYLFRIFKEDFWNLQLPMLAKIEKKSWPVLRTMIERGINSPLSSSAGRIFDAVSALCGICLYSNYEGQAAIQLEMAAQRGDDPPYPFTIHANDLPMVIDIDSTVEKIVEELAFGVHPSMISARFHRTMSAIIEKVCRNIRNLSGIRRVTLSGGVFQNMLLLEMVVPHLRDSGFEVYVHHQVPPNDGGLSLGQAAIAAARW